MEGITQKSCRALLPLWSVQKISMGLCGSIYDSNHSDNNDIDNDNDNNSNNNRYNNNKNNINEN